MCLYSILFMKFIVSYNNSRYFKDTADWRKLRAACGRQSDQLRDGELWTRPGLPNREIDRRDCQYVRGVQTVGLMAGYSYCDITWEMESPLEAVTDSVPRPFKVDSELTDSARMSEPIAGRRFYAPI